MLGSYMYIYILNLAVVVWQCCWSSDVQTNPCCKLTSTSYLTLSFFSVKKKFRQIWLTFINWFKGHEWAFIEYCCDFNNLYYWIWAGFCLPAGLIHLSFKFECNYVNLGLIRILMKDKFVLCSASCFCFFVFF